MTEKEKAEKLLELRNFYGLSEAAAVEKVNILNQLDKQRAVMSQGEIMAYAAKIRPVLPGDGKSVDIGELPGKLKLYWLKSTAIYHASCTYNGEFIREAEGLKELARITTYHTYGGYHGFLRPSADEAIWQCPKEILDKVCAFEFYTPVFDVNYIYDKMLDRHILTTIYYEGTVPEDIASEPIKW